MDTESMLFKLVRKKDPKALSEWIQRAEVDVNVCNAAGATVMHHALERDRQESAWVLLEAGGDPYKADANGETPYELAVRQEQIWFVQKVMTKYPKHFDLDKELLTFAATEHYLVSQTLIGLGAKPGPRDETGRTALHLLVMSYKGFVIRDLKTIDRAVLDAQDNHGHTALWYACKYNDYAGKDALIKHGATDAIAD